MLKGNPNYELKARERELIPKNETTIYLIIKRIVYFVIGVIVIGSILLHENLLAELSGTSKVILFVLVVHVITKGGHIQTAIPFEIWFYDDYMIVYREKVYYSKNDQRKSYDKFFYKDIHKIQYQKKSNRINIFGITEWKYYKYKKDGTLPDKPTKHRKVDGSCYFYPIKEDGIDFVGILEKYTMMKMEFRDT